MVIAIGIILILLGIVGVIFSRHIFNFTGSIDFVESRFPGSSGSFIKLLAVLLVFVGILMLTNSTGWITSPVTGYLDSLFPAR